MQKQVLPKCIYIFPGTAKVQLCRFQLSSIAKANKKIMFFCNWFSGSDRVLFSRYFHRWDELEDLGPRFCSSSRQLPEKHVEHHGLCRCCHRVRELQHIFRLTSHNTTPGVSNWYFAGRIRPPMTFKMSKYPKITCF